MLKRILITLSCLTFFSCGKIESPAETASGFITAMQNNRFDEAKKYATNESDGLISVLAKVPEEHLFPVKPSETFDISGIRKKGNAWIVWVTIRETGQILQLRVINQNGRWKVAYDLNTLLQSAS